MNRRDYEKALYIIDMNNGFVNFGNMANPKYNALVPEQLRMIDKFNQEGGLVNFILEGHNKNSIEFNSYPEHCILGTKEAEVIPEFIPQLKRNNTQVFYKNCINGMLNDNLRDNIKRLKALREVVIEGVCADLCVMDFARTYARFLDELDQDTKIFVVKNAIDTFDSPEHNRSEWLNISYKVMEQAGIILVDSYEELENKERKLIR